MQKENQISDSKTGKLLTLFQNLKEDELVECGYDSEIEFKRLKNIEGSCLILNTFILFLNFAYVFEQLIFSMR